MGRICELRHWAVIRPRGRGARSTDFGRIGYYHLSDRRFVSQIAPEDDAP